MYLVVMHVFHWSAWFTLPSLPHNFVKKDILTGIVELTLSLSLPKNLKSCQTEFMAD